MTFWIAPIETLGHGVEYEEVTTSHFKTAVNQALTRFENGSWTIAADLGTHGGGPGDELAYHAESDNGTLFVHRAALRYLGSAAMGVGHGHQIEGLSVQHSPEALVEQWQADGDRYRMLRTAGHSYPYPGELQNFDHFSDTSYGNDVTDSVQFSIGDRAFRVWISPARVVDRPAESLDGQYAVAAATVTPGQTIEDLLEDDSRWASDVVFETDDPKDLLEYFNRIWNERAAGLRARGAAAGRQAASPERQLGLDAAALPPYHGWKIEYHADAKLYEAHHPDSDIHLQWTIDEPARGQIGIAAMELDGVLEDGRVAFATMGRDADKLLAAVKGWMDRYQPSPKPEDLTAARFAQLEIDRGPRRTAGAPDVDDTAERFKMIELNPRGRKNPRAAGGPKVYRLQKVTGTLARDLAPEGVKPGVVSTPEQLVGETLAPFLDDRATESFVTVFLNVRNKIVGYSEYTMGSTTGVSVDTAGIMRDALTMGAAGMVTAHNHPTGDPQPSADDRALWARLKAAGELIGIPVVDNLVVGGDGRFFSESLDGAGRTTVRRRAAAEKNPARYPSAGALQQQTISRLTGNPIEVRSADGGLEGVFAREEDAEHYADELRRIGARGVKVEKRTRMHPAARKKNPQEISHERDLAEAAIAYALTIDRSHQFRNNKELIRDVAMRLGFYNYPSIIAMSCKPGFRDLVVSTAEEAGWNIDHGVWHKLGTQMVAKINPSEEICDTDILDGMARTLWLTAYADHVESLSKDERKAGDFPVNLSGITWDDHAPETPASAYDAARDLYLLFDRANGEKTVGQLYDQACFVDKIRPTTKIAHLFGHYLAMQAMGEGVSWFDDHKTFPLKFPRGFEVHYDDGEVWWSPQVRSRENPVQKRGSAR